MKLVCYPPVEPDRYKKIVEAAGAMDVVNAENERQALEEIREADAFFGKITPGLLASARRLRWVQSPTASLEHYLFPELIDHPCIVTNMRGLYSDVIADHVFGFVLCFARNLHRYLRQQKDHRWQPVGGENERSTFETGPAASSAIDLAHLHLADCTLGVVGLGHIGREVARRASAFGMSVVACDPVVTECGELIQHLWGPEQLDALLECSDFVVICAPHTPHTQNMFGMRQFEKMKSTAYLINIGRGAIVDLNELTNALQNNTIAGAALDVFEIEPLPPGHPLWAMENVILTPHVAAASPRIAERHLRTLLENIRRFAAGLPLENIVNKQSWF